MKQIALMLLVVAVLGGGYWFLTQSQGSALNDKGIAMMDKAAENSNTVTEPSGVTLSEDSMGSDGQLGSASEVVVLYDGSAFTPAEVTIHKGEKVTFKSTGAPMWVATAMHPDHKGYAGTTLKEHCPDTTDTAFDQCAAGATYTTKFEKVGTWPYHNHVKGGAYGKVIVIE